MVTKIDRELDSLLARPAMWGPDSAVEMQFLLLMDYRRFATDAQPTTRRAGNVGYRQALINHFGGSAMPVFSHLSSESSPSSEKTKKLVEILSEARRLMLNEESRDD